ncbi:NUDIX hydrolase [Sediminibacillus massiliensis]|uniref:NUDIX hydrolase n=1 Tax=Sediminibacillus massiliensis TaxID=1926277 RepID=UPI0009883A68|nr:NUDIX domain-containing protein [Sediminibacillus massiliensis]
MEYLEILDQSGKKIGTADRDTVHREGYWHETFHCWFVSRENGIDYIYLQKRSHLKKDFPDLFDITAAGHILAEETIQDGVREIKEELGIDVPIEHLTDLGVVEDIISSNGFIDKERAHVFLYWMEGKMDSFLLQKEEVAGISQTPFIDFFHLCFKKKEKITLEGFDITELGEQNFFAKEISIKDIVPHQSSYFNRVALLIEKELKQK